MKTLNSILIALLVLPAIDSSGQECAAGAVRTHDAYLYGRFETRMRSVEGDGVVSSFFLYNVDLGCNWPAQNNEIDIEMTGNRNDSVQFTTHYPGPWSATQIVPTAFNPHADMHVYAFEWEPGIVRWFIDGNLAYVQDENYVHGLIYPMRIMMNLWAAEIPAWVGTWDPAIMPAHSSYDYVSYYAYTPGTGNSGTDDNFTLQWTDQFDELDTGRWEVSEFGQFGGNYCTFVAPNVDASGGELSLSLTEPLTPTFSLVRFSVDASSLDLAAGDIIYLNGTFNGWCGGCNPMYDPDGDGVWELVLALPAGNHEYLFTKNVWQELGGPPLGSSCDFSPCDTYNNYGVTVAYEAGAIDTGTYCWGTCDDCGVVDSDGDGIADNHDNCLAVANPQQEDTNADGFGNICDADLNGDCIVNSMDLGVFRSAFFSVGANDADFNSDAQVNALDLGILRLLFFGQPGPSALANCP
jgi:hypothetical protein